MHNLAGNYAALDRHADALKLREETLAAQRRVFPPDHPDLLLSLWGVASSLIKLDRGAEAVPRIDECVTRAAGKLVDPRMIPTVMDMRLRHFQKANDPAGCRDTAELWVKLDRRDADSLYNIACCLAIASAIQAKATKADALRLAADDADKAMEWLKKAITAGYKDRANLAKDADLDALRDRADFKTLLSAIPA
jgi:tetratricopeptide (TPR) repeat protein